LLLVLLLVLLLLPPELLVLLPPHAVRNAIATSHNFLCHFITLLPSFSDSYSIF